MRFSKRFFGARNKISGLLAAASLAVSPAFAYDHDTQAWLGLFANKKLDERWSLYAEGQGRYGDEIGRLSQTLLRTGVGYKLTDNVTVLLGYGYISTDRNNIDDVGENRIFQQVSWRPGEFAGVKVSTRTRLEQRFVNTGDDTGWRFRQSVKVVRPLTESGSLDLVGLAEVFVALNDTDFGANAGIDQLRLFAGVGFPLTKEIRVETGYLNQNINRPQRDNAMNHALSLFVNVNF